jgi:hypothetical protein
MSSTASFILTESVFEPFIRDDGSLITGMRVLRQFCVLVLLPVSCLTPTIPCTIPNAQMSIEYLQQINGRLPANGHPSIGPDATGAVWVYEYAIVDKSGKHSLADLRSLQDGIHGMPWRLYLELLR